MLFVSGLAYSGKEVHASLSFFVHRFLRLVVPVYLFLTFYFVAAFSMKYLAGIDFGITVRHVVGSYLLMDGIGYVWIIRVFLLVAMLTPLLVKINAAVKDNLAFASLLVAVVALQEVLVSSGVGMDAVLVREFVYYALGYSVIFLLGLRIKKAGKTPLWIAIATLLFAASRVYELQRYDVAWVNNFKYPPQFYFLAYGAMMSLVCFWIVGKAGKIQEVKLLNFIGRNTIWIYLWHIPFIQLTGLLELDWWFRYMVVYLLAVTVCYVQVSVVDRMRLKHENISILKYLKG